MMTTIHWWQIFRIAKWVLKFDNKEQNWEKKLPDKRRLSSNWERGTNWVRWLLPVHPSVLLVSFYTRKTTGTHKATWACVLWLIQFAHLAQRWELRVLGCYRWVFWLFEERKAEDFKLWFQNNWLLNGKRKGTTMFKGFISPTRKFPNILQRFKKNKHTLWISLGESLGWKKIVFSHFLY